MTDMTLQDYFKCRFEYEMKKMCYMNGKDYYFGKTEWNNNETLFFNPATPNITSAIYSANMLIAKNLFSDDRCPYANHFTNDKIPNAFGIFVEILKCPEYEIVLNIMKMNELEEKIKAEPDRWKFYQEHKAKLEEDDE